MCGIFGSPKFTPSVREMLPHLAIAMEERGKGAWGYSDGGFFAKHLGPITNTWWDERDGIACISGGMFHTRASSPGQGADVHCAHPFVIKRPDGQTVTGIHNGYIQNHAELDRKYHRNCAVDSMHLWEHRAAGLPWSDLYGWGNIAWYEPDDEGIQRLNLARFNHDALEVVQLKGGEYLFCSTIDPLLAVTKMYGNPIERRLRLDKNARYTFTDAGFIQTEDDLNFVTIIQEPKVSYVDGVWTEPETRFHQPFGMGSPASPRSVAGITPRCFKCNVSRVSTKGYLLCDSCFYEIVNAHKDPTPSGTLVPMAMAYPDLR
jgi:hypothetical protein